ncbi:hypothetical protein [Intrasporangium mesophilum]
MAGVEVVATAQGGTVVARRHTDSSGRAVLDLPTGTVTLTASPAAPPRVTPRPTQVTVGSGPVPTVTLLYESSMQ